MSSQVSSLQSEKTEFKKVLKLFDATTLVMGSMIGSGVFVVISGMMQKSVPSKGIWGVPYPGLMLLVWVVCGIITLMGALTYAELAGSMPKAGGPYVFLREAFGPFPAFLYGWTLFFAIQTGTIAAVAVIFGRAAVALFSHHAFSSISGEAWSTRFVAVGCLIFLTFWNIFGIRMGAFIQNLFTVIKVAAIAVLIGIGFSKPEVLGQTSFMPHFFSKDLVMGFGAAMVGALWAYDAWFNVMFAGEEVVNAKNILPKALILGTVLVMVLYCLTNAVYVHVLPVSVIQGLHASHEITGIEAAKAIMGGIGALFITAAILFSTFGCANGILLSGPRAYYAMAKDGLFFKQVSKIHPVYKTPVISLLVQLVWSVILILLPGETYGKLFTYVEFATFLFYAITTIGLFVLRKKYPDLERPFKVPDIIPVLYFILVVAFLVNTFLTQTMDSVYGLLIIAVGAFVYIGMNRRGFQRKI
jgi:APA family basic amino acid/polyamine antiporter